MTDPIPTLEEGEIDPDSIVGGTEVPEDDEPFEGIEDMDDESADAGDVDHLAGANDDENPSSDLPSGE